MNRRKLSVRTLMCLLACATAACSSDLDQKEIPVRGEGERIAITATAGMPQDQPSTRLGFDNTTDPNKLKLTWRPVGDPKGKESFSVLSGTGSTTPSTFTMQSMDASGATFTGEIIPVNKTTYYAVYPALAAASPVAATAIPLVMTGQTGDAPDESKVYMYSSSTYTAGGTLNFGFQCLTSIVKATLKFPAALAGAAASQVTFIATDGLYTKADANITVTPATYNPTAGSLALSSTFPLSNDANAETTVYLHVLPGTLTDFRVKATAGGKSYIGTVAASATIDASKMYTKTVEMKDPLADAEVGDFYCKGSDYEGYLIPRDATLTEEQKKACVGIVFWVGSEARDQDPLLKQDYPDCSHGLVVALQDTGDKTSVKWSKASESVQQKWVQNSPEYGSFVNIQLDNKMCGYSNTLALMAYNTKKGDGNELRVLPCDAILDYSIKNPAPTNSSDWYLPSIMELKYVCWGQGNEVQGVTGRDYLNTQIDKVTGEKTSFSETNYWSSTEVGSYPSNAWRVKFNDGAVAQNDKGINNFLVRPILAF